MALSCCQYRTWVLALGFTIGTCEVTMAVVFYTYMEEVRHLIGYQVSQRYVICFMIKCDFSLWGGIPTNDYHS